MPERSGESTHAPLQLSYQLRDASGRTAVDAAAMTLRPLLSYAAGVAAPAGVAAVSGGSPLPSCDASGTDPVSGIGACRVPVDASYFPTTGSLGATVVVQLLAR